MSAISARLGFGSFEVIDIQTPPELYKDLDAEFHFDHDPCPLMMGEFIKDNPHLDGLKTEWGKCNFVNPPYNAIRKWITKGLMEWRKGKTVVFLIPNRIHSATWFKDVWPNVTEVRIISHFGFPGYKKKSPFGVVIAIFKAGLTAGNYSKVNLIQSGLTTYALA